MVVLLMLRLS
uniref:Uncharacterized protein n=1 Tax=Rhizophora mucronata TaxID=61149 RepID=A0A2P2ILU3_RHIMU